MKRNKLKKLSLNRETLHSLETLRLVMGADGTVLDQNGNIVIAPISNGKFPCTNELSICITCTKPIDGCPDPTVA